MKTKTTHWTNRSSKDFAFAIAADFIVQLENRMESPPITQKKLAEKIGLSKGYISQKFHNPGNLSLETIVEFSSALNMKVAIVTYDDNDPNNDNGPINSDIFRICWEKANKPRDFWAFEKKSETTGMFKDYEIQPPIAKVANNEATLAKGESKKTASKFSLLRTEKALATI